MFTDSRAILQDGSSDEGLHSTALECMDVHWNVWMCTRVSMEII